MGKIILLSLVGCFGIASLASAAELNAPGRILEQQRDTRDYLEQQERLKALIEKEAVDSPTIENRQPMPEIQSVPESAVEVSFTVKRFEVNESEVLTKSELASILDPAIGQTVTINQLLDIINSINALYREKRYVGAEALLPPQKITSGIVKIKLIESHIGKVRLKFNETTNDDYILGRLQSQPGDLLSLDRLEDELFYFNSLNDIRLQAQLKPGEAVGTTDFNIQVIEPNRHQFSLLLDNAGTDDIGRERASINYTNRSLLGWRDQFRMGLTKGEGSESVLSSYEMPINKLGTKLLLSADQSKVDIIGGQLAVLDISSKSSNQTINLSHPLIVRQGLIMKGFSEINNKKSTTYFTGEELFQTKIKTLVFGHDGLWVKQDYIISNRTYVTGPLSGTDNVDGFIKFNSDLSWTNFLEQGRTLSLRGRVQFTPDDLLPSTEQFQLGGMSSVRGYKEGLLTGDKGYFLSMEYSAPLALENAAGKGFRTFTFADHGAAYAFKGNNARNNRDDYLTSVGFGLDMAFSNGFGGRFTVGIPVFSREDKEDEATIHFYLQYAPN
jgi:hemolysin activation/secretion protein